MTNTPNSAQDDTAAQPGAGQGGDALAQLEALLQKTRANKGQADGDSMGGGMPSQPSQEDIQAQAEALARVEAEKIAAFEAQMAQAEVERKQALEEQQKQMAELSETPQYQARVEQQEHEEKQHQEEKSEHDGHQIIQITTKKL